MYVINPNDQTMPTLDRNCHQQKLTSKCSEDLEHIVGNDELNSSLKCPIHEAKGVQ